jgi:hypothetical protein
MLRGKILKVRPGDEANFSAGSVFLDLMVLTGPAVTLATLLPASIIVSGIQAAKLRAGKSPRRRPLYWAIPVGLGIICTWLTIAWVRGFGDEYSNLLPPVLGMGASFVLVCLAGYALSPRMRHVGWLVLLAPLILVLGSAASFLCSTGVRAVVWAAPVAALALPIRFLLWLAPSMLGAVVAVWVAKLIWNNLNASRRQRRKG